VEGARGDGRGALTTLCQSRKRHFGLYNRSTLQRIAHCLREAYLRDIDSVEIRNSALADCQYAGEPVRDMGNEAKR